MNALEILLISLGVSVDAFAVSVGGALGCSRNMVRCGLSAGLFFGGFQFLMPVAGFFAAGLLAEAVQAWDHWCAFGLLALVGGKMIFEGLRELCRKKETAEPEQVSCRSDFFSPVNLIVPAVATSLDALAVGASFAFSGQSSVWLPALSMGVVTGVISFGGVALGHRLKRFGGEGAMNIAGGCVIVLIGFRILWEHCR